MSLQRAQALTGIAFMITAIILGAFGAHALKSQLSPDQLASFETGIRYQLIHGLALIAIGMRNPGYNLNNERAIFILMTLGVALFSFSIYLLNLQSLINLKLGWIGPITPIGGTLLIASWCVMFFSVKNWTSKQ